MDDIRLGERQAGARTPGVRYLSYNGVAGPQGVVEGIPDLKRSGLGAVAQAGLRLCPGGTRLCSALPGPCACPRPPSTSGTTITIRGVDTSGLPFREEDGLLLQAGWRAALPTGTSVEVSPYYYRISHYIQFDLINFVAYNIDRAELAGLEARGQPGISAGGWTAFANYSYQKSRPRAIRSSAVRRPGRPGISPRSPTCPPTKPMSVSSSGRETGPPPPYSLRRVSSQKVVYNNNILYNTDLRVRTQRGLCPARLRGPLSFRQKIDRRLFLRNIFNASYQERFGFPAAGRNVGLSLSAAF